MPSREWESRQAQWLPSRFLSELYYDVNLVEGFCCLIMPSSLLTGSQKREGARGYLALLTAFGLAHSKQCR
jgi:hypothetical protein